MTGERYERIERKKKRLQKKAAVVIGMGNSWSKNGKVIDRKGEGSMHHLFDYYEVREKMVEIYGEPDTHREHEKIQKMARRFMDNQPLIEMDPDEHNEVHSD